VTEKRTVFLTGPTQRSTAKRYIDESPEDHMVTIQQRTRTLDQNAKFHAICGDLAKSDMTWAGKRRTLAQWKVLLVSGHAVATKEGSEIVPGLENEFVNIRESTAQMSKKRGASLITYAIAFCDEAGVVLSETAIAEFA